MLKITVNGSTMEFSEGLTVNDLLRHLQVEAQMIAVEQNREIVPKAEFGRRQISNGDRIEVVHFVGGG